jgi:alpha-1,2-mannosyltransferase
MRDKNFKLLLLALCVFYQIVVVTRTVGELSQADGLLFANGTPVGGDFINMWSAARMVLGGLSEAIYQPEAFMAFERTIIPQQIGLRLWAYPPHSLLFVPPLGWLGFFEALTIWSLLGLITLAFGARRIGFDWLETAIILLSPAVLFCLYNGQTGNFAAGLMLLALSGRRSLDALSIISAALLTIKPQTGFLLPVLWVIQGRWRLIFAVGIVTLILLAASIMFFGAQAWWDYLGETLPVLNALEREGTGPFMLMIPSVFMSFRILLGDGELAATLHQIFAIAVFAVLIWRLLATKAVMVQNALILVGTTLITPYLHNYDLALLLAAALLVVRLAPDKRLLAYTLVGVAWGLPALIVQLNAAGVPVSPLLILPLLWLAGRKPILSKADGLAPAGVSARPLEP